MMIGVVLCGGESKRMGTDKGLLPIVSYTWAQYAEDKLAALKIPVVISINNLQLSAYSKMFPIEKLVLDQANAKGPVNGLLSVHQLYPDKDLILLACDMTEMDIDTLKILKNSIQTYPSFDYYLFEHKGFMEPMCAIYTSKALKSLLKALQSKAQLNFALHKLIKQGTYKALEIKDYKKFSNYNT